MASRFSRCGGRKCRNSCALATTLLVALVGLYGCSSPPDKAGAAAHLAKGKDFLEQDLVEEALKELKEAVKCDPTDAEAHTELSKALDDNNQGNQAMLEMEIAVKLAPDDADKADRYVAMLEDFGKYEKAIETEKKLLAMRPNDAMLKRQAAWLFEQVGDHKTALSLIRDAVKADPNEEHGWYTYGKMLNDMGKSTEAVQVLKQGLKKCPESNEIYYEIGLILSASKRPYEAVAPLKKAIELAGEDGDADAEDLLKRLNKAAGKPLYLVKLQKVGMSFFADVVINEKIRTKLVLDSGATSVVISKDVATRSGVNLASAPDKEFDSVTGSGVAKEVTLSSIRVGDAKISDVRALVHDMPSQNGEAGLLGMTFLSHFKFTLDAEHSTLWLMRP